MRRSRRKKRNCFKGGCSSQEKANKDTAINKGKRIIREKLDGIEREIGVIQTAISIAEQSIDEGNNGLGMCLRNKALSKAELIPKIQQAQSKIEMGAKRKEELEKDMEIVLNKKKRIMDEKK